MANISNSASNTLIMGTSGNDSIYSTGDSVTVDAGAGADTISVTGALAYVYHPSIDGGAGNDFMHVTGNGITVKGGDGADTITGDYSSSFKYYVGSNVYGDSKIYGGAGNDSISLYGVNDRAGSALVSIEGGTGDDIISHNIEDKRGYILPYANGDGNDTLVNFNAYDTIKITSGNYTTAKSGSDFVIKVGKGSIRVKDVLASDSTAKIHVQDSLGNVTVYNDISFIVGTDGDDYLSNSITNSVTIDAGAGDDTIYNDNGDYVSINGGAGNDSINNNEFPDYSTINAGDGNDTLAGNAFNSFVDMGAGNDFVSMMGAGGYGSTFEGGAGDDTIYTSILGSVSGGDGNDLINVETYTFTLNGGKGDDTINVDPRYFGVSTRTYEYKPGDGNDLIIGFSKKDSLLIAGGEYSTAVSGNDIIVTVGEGKITLKDAKGIEPIIRDFVDSQDTIGISVFNSTSDTIINGSAGYDSIVNSRAKDVTINAGAGNDTIENRNYSEAFHLLINAGDGDDNISNDGEYATINAGDGDDHVYNGGYSNSSGRHGAHHSVIDLGNGDDGVSNYENYITIYGGAGNDNILNNGDYTVINVGDGNDTILNSGANVLFKYAEGDGNDSISGFNATSTLRIAGSYDTQKSGKNVIITVGDGKITLVGAASLATLNIQSEEVSDSQWQLDGTTATYGTPDNTLVTVNGVKSLDGISLEGNVVTISAAALGTSKVTISSGYTLALGKDAAVPKTVAASYNANTQIYTSAGKTAGYTLANNAISYTAGTSKEFAFSGIADTATTKGFYVSASKKTIAIGASAINSDKTIPVELLNAPEGYKMELGSSLPKPVTISANTYDAKTMTYKTAGTTGTYTLSSDGKTISYTAGTSKEFKFSGIADSALTKGFFVSDKKKTIAIGASAINPDKTIPVKLLSAPAGYKMELGSSLLKPKTISANTYDTKTQTYNTKGTTAGYTLIDGGKTIRYTPGTSKEFTFSGIADTATTKGFFVSDKKKTIAIGASAINSEKTIPVKLLSAPAGYKMELGSSLPKAKNIGTSTLEDGFYTAAGQTVGYTLSHDAKTIKYHEALDTAFELDGIAAEPTAPTNGVVTLTPENFDKRLSVMSNEAEYAFSIAKGTYTGKTFTGSANADTITSAGAKLVINAGKGNDSIENSGAGAKINGGLGNDYVKNSGSNVTLNGGTGNDTLWGGNYAETFVYKSGDGKDIIGGFDDNDLLQITGTFTTAHDSAAGTIKFTVGTGSITLTDFTATTFNVNGDAYQISGKQLVKK